MVPLCDAFNRNGILYEMCHYWRRREGGGGLCQREGEGGREGRRKRIGKII